MKKIILVIMYVTIVSVVLGCVPNQNNNNVNKPQNSNVDISNNNTISNNDEVESTVDKEHNNTSNENIQNITQEDLDINYKDIIINDIIPFKQIADALEIEIGKTDSNIELKAMSQIGEWYVVHYPSKEAEDIRLQYIVNEQLGTQKIVQVDLYNVDTFRGISVGDDLEELLDAYGDDVKPEYNSSTTDWYCYSLDTTGESYPDKSIGIVVDKNSKKVTKISINYYQNGAMEELGFGNFD